MTASSYKHKFRYRLVRNTYGTFAAVRRNPAENDRSLSSLAFGLLWLLVSSIAWENVIVVPGFGTIGKLIGVVAFGAAVLAIVDRGKIQRIAILHGLMALFVIWGSFTYFWSQAPERTKEEVGTYIQLLIMVWLIRELASTPELQRRLLGAYVLGTYVSAIMTFVSYQSGAAAHYNRFVAEGFNPGDLALMLVLSIPLSFYLSSIEKNRVLLWVYRLHPGFMIAAILLTAARGALIDLGLAMLYVPISFNRWTLEHKIVMTILSGCALVCILLVVPSTSWSRFGTIGKEVSSGTLNERTIIWQAGFDLLRTYPLQGVGVNAFAPAVQRSLGNPKQIRHAAANELVEYVAHNSFISVLVEEGLVGFVLFLLILIALWRGIAQLDPPRRRLWAIELLVWTIGVMELTWEYRKPTWLLFGLLAAAITSVNRSSSLNARYSVRNSLAFSTR